jgi:NADH-quinone oxidoreductase subunit M
MALNGHLLSFLIFFPAVGALALLWLRGDDEAWIRRFTFVVSTIEFLASLLLLRAITIGNSEYQLQEFAAWIPAVKINYHLGVDGISLFLVILTTFLTPICVLASYKGVHFRIKEFHVMLLLLEVGVIGVFLSLDMFLFFLFWEIMLIPMAFLIGIWGHDRRIYAAVKFVLYTMAGSILMLVGIIWLYSQTGTFDLPAIQEAIQRGGLIFSERTEMLLFLAFFVAFAIKVPLFPLHTWLPDAHVEAPTAGSVILAGVLLKMGTYGFIRFSLPFFPDVLTHTNIRGWMIGLSLVAIIYGALVSLIQKDMKKLVAYSSVSHLGFCTLGIFALNPVGLSGSVLQQINHGISTGALFLIVGILYERRHTREIAEYGGISNVMPVYATITMIMFLSSMGLPLLNGFIGEFTILQGTFMESWRWAAWAAPGVVLAAAYLLWLYQRVFFGTVTNPKNEHLHDLSGRELATFVPLLIMAFWIGLYPKPFFQILEQPVNHTIAVVRPDYPPPGAPVNATTTEPSGLMRPASAAGSPPPGSAMRAASQKTAAATPEEKTR